MCFREETTFTLFVCIVAVLLSPQLPARYNMEPYCGGAVDSGDYLHDHAPMFSSVLKCSPSLNRLYWQIDKKVAQNDGIFEFNTYKKDEGKNPYVAAAIHAVHNKGSLQEEEEEEAENPTAATIEMAYMWINHALFQLMRTRQVKKTRREYIATIVAKEAIQFRSPGYISTTKGGDSRLSQFIMDFPHLFTDRDMKIYTHKQSFSGEMFLMIRLSDNNKKKKNDNITWVDYNNNNNNMEELLLEPTNQTIKTNLFNAVGAGDNVPTIPFVLIMLDANGNKKIGVPKPKLFSTLITFNTQLAGWRCSLCISNDHDDVKLVSKYAIHNVWVKKGEDICIARQANKEIADPLYRFNGEGDPDLWQDEQAWRQQYNISPMYNNHTNLNSSSSNWKNTVRIN